MIAEREVLPAAGAGGGSLPYTGERIVPGKTPEPVLREHETRYVFAGRRVRDLDILDLACGTGMGTHYLLRAGARSCLGLDIDAAAVAYARAAYRDCRFELGDAANLPLANQSFDAVVSFETIEHLRDQRKFLRECQRVLRPGGLLICSTPNRTMNGWKNRNPHHVREFTAAEFAGFLEDGFSQVALYAQNRESYWLRLAETTIAGALQRFGMRSAVRRLLRGQAAAPPQRREFDERECDVDGEIQPYVAAWHLQPRYLLGVARKAAPRSA